MTIRDVTQSRTRADHAEFFLSDESFPFECVFVAAQNFKGKAVKKVASDQLRFVGTQGAAECLLWGVSVEAWRWTDHSSRGFDYRLLCQVLCRPEM